MAHTDPHSPPQSTAAGYEVTDANLGGVERLIVVMALCLAVAFGLMWLMYKQLATREAGLDVKPSPVIQRQGDRQPPVPRLQTLPARDLAGFRQGESDVLESWAWVDKERGIAKIPVSRAIEILAERGLPVPPKQAAPVPVDHTGHGHDMPPAAAPTPKEP